MSGYTYSVNNQVELGTVLDFCTQPIIFLDSRFDVFYFNFRALHFFQVHEAAFRSCDENFDPNILNRHLMIFEEKLFHRLDEMFLLKLGQMLTERVQIGYLHLELRITPLFSTQNEKLGCCVEINDRTELLNTLDLLNITIENAQEGLFDTSIPLQSVSKEYEILPQIGRKINTLFETIHQFFGEMACAFEALINGELFYSMPITEYEQHYPESFFSSTKADFNYVLRNLCGFVKDIKKSSRLMTELLSQLLMKNSELAMTSEKDNAETMKIVQHLSKSFNTIRSTHSEIHQAVEIANNLNVDHSALDGLRDLFHKIKNQLKTVADNAQYMHYVFKGHLSGFQSALSEIHVGNIGKGIHIVTSECEALIQNTTALMQTIQTTIQTVNNQVDYSVDHVLKTVSSNNNTMHETISLMSTVLKEIQKTLAIQDSEFDEFNQSITVLQSSHQETTTSIENTFLLTSLLVNIINELSHALGKFIEDINPIPPEENLKEEIAQLLMVQKEVSNIVRYT